MATSSVLLAVAAAIALNTAGTDSPENLKPSASESTPSLSGQLAQPQNLSAKKSVSKNLQQPVLQQGRLITVNRASRVNIRSQPTINSFRRAYGIYGDEVNILDIQSGLDDSYRWYQVEFPISRIRGWVREDLILELSPSVTGQPPVNRHIEEHEGFSAVDAETHQAVVPSPASPYTAEQIDYFTEIALGSEFGNASEQVRKWEDDIRIQIHGNPTASDRHALEQIIHELNVLLNQETSNNITIEIVDDQTVDRANVDMYFVPHSDFHRYEPNYQPGNMGFAYVNWLNNRIYRARILITTEGITQIERSHLIREELTQSLGLLRDSYQYSDSIFYQGWTSTNAFSPLDQLVIQMLYSRSITPGMNSYQARTALEQMAMVAVKESAKNSVFIP